LPCPDTDAPGSIKRRIPDEADLRRPTNALVGRALTRGPAAAGAESAPWWVWGFLADKCAHTLELHSQYCTKADGTKTNFEYTRLDVCDGTCPCALEGACTEKEVALCLECDEAPSLVFGDPATGETLTCVQPGLKGAAGVARGESAIK
jgi:hypothetical protein